MNNADATMTIKKGDSIALSYGRYDFVMICMKDSLVISLSPEDQILVNKERSHGYHIIISNGNAKLTKISGFGNYSRIASKFTELDREKIDIGVFIKDYVARGKWVIDD